MYTVFCDGVRIHDHRIDDLMLISPKLTLEENIFSQFDFTISPKNPQYSILKKMSSNIVVYQNEEEIFSGRITEEKGDFYKRKTIHCEGELAYLKDSIQPPTEYHDMTVRGFLSALLEVHNSKVANDKKFQVGAVTVIDSNDSLYRYTNYETTLGCINEKLIKRLGGHLRIRKQNGVRYLDYLQDYPRTNTQVIEFGKNLLDFSKNFDLSDIATVIIPLGAKLDESPIAALEAYTTIESVNSGKNYVKSDVAIRNFGWIEKIVKWEDVHVPANLKSKAERYLTDFQYEKMVLEIQAIDFHSIDIDVECIHLLDEIRVLSKPHDLDRYFPVTKLVIPLDHPAQATFTLGTTVSSSLSTAGNSLSSDLTSATSGLSKSQILKEARDNATQLIHSALNGHVVTTADEQLIMDTDNIETARKLWRWNLNGLGYSKTGYNGRYETAITMDGQIVGERIVGGSIAGEKLDITYRSEVEKAISDAQLGAEYYADGRLKSYYTKVEAETSIKNTSNSILLSAKETATAYTDSKLKNYSTSAEIKVTTDAISSEVKKKLNTSEFSTKVQQSATDIQIAWNNISKYIQFASGELRIYDSAVSSTQKLRSVFNSEGEHFYRDNYYVGMIGTNQWSSDTSHKGLVFDLNGSGKYMAFAQRAGSSGSYTTMLCFSRANSIYTEYGIHSGCNLYMHNYELHNARIASASAKYSGTWYNGYTGVIPICTAISIQSTGNGGISWSYNTSKIRVANGIVVGYWN